MSGILILLTIYKIDHLFANIEFDAKRVFLAAASIVLMDAILLIIYAVRFTECPFDETLCYFLSRVWTRRREHPSCIDQHLLAQYLGGVPRTPSLVLASVPVSHAQPQLRVLVTACNCS